MAGRIAKYQKKGKTFIFLNGDQVFRMIYEPVSSKLKDLFVTRVRFKKGFPVFIKPVSFFRGREEFLKVNFAQESYRICLVIRKYGPCHGGKTYTSWLYYNSTYIKFLNVNISPASRKALSKRFQKVIYMLMSR